MDILSNAAAMFDHMCEGILIIDKNGVVVYGNQAYLEYLKTDASKLFGKKLLDVRPEAELPLVLKTGHPILNASRKKPAPFFVNMYPIWSGGEVVGGISVVTFLRQAYIVQKLLQEAERSKELIKRISMVSNATYTFDDIVAEEAASLKTKEMARRAAATDATILLRSESGTGKELYAQAIHNASARNGGIFLAVNCANFRTELLESDLFGYVEGSFTGAKKGGKIGIFEAASGGTVFLDEISEMDVSLQSKLLRVLQDHTIRPLGDVREYEVNIRIIAACNADLEHYMETGRFRKDLYYRLNAFPIRIAPLKERPGDIAPLVTLFLKELARKQRRDITVEPAAMQCLRAYHWPGNVRELRNVLEFVSYLSDDGIIDVSLLPEGLLGQHGLHDATESLAQRVRRFERAEIQRLLQTHGSDLKGKKKTASVLGISLSSLYGKLQAGAPPE